MGPTRTGACVTTTTGGEQMTPMPFHPQNGRKVRRRKVVAFGTFGSAQLGSGSGSAKAQVETLALYVIQANIK